ncbi:MFS-type transporter SLC18B1 [Trichinella pseudospiralis]|uniref:MFS-type transporter SLC18B1 n=1 Tax=Trichinella pseudospiralis TaxID=6337 RepID=A0A0V1K6D9_TRIPS|nr:MFS-type transporter SLC18B1 [Trichinella pseudospiralis]
MCIIGRFNFWPLNRKNISQIHWIRMNQTSSHSVCNENEDNLSVTTCHFMDHNLETEENKLEESNFTDEHEFPIKRCYIGQQKSIIAILAGANLSSAARKHYVGRLAIGVTLGIYELVIFLLSPLMGSVMYFVGPKLQFNMGLFVLAVSTVLFGLLKWSPPSDTFVTLSIAVRVVEALGNAAFLTASLALVMRTLPENFASTIGVLETFSGIGYTVGPPLGGILYDVLGGFDLPFFSLGVVLLFTVIMSFLIIPEQRDNAKRGQLRMTSLLRAPLVLVEIISIAFTAASMSFIDPTLEEHLKEFSMSSLNIGLMFLIAGVAYCISAPLCGYFIDKLKCPMEFMVVGNILASAGFFIIGPSPLMNATKSILLMSVSLFLIGISMALMLISHFNLCLQAIKNQGYADVGDASGIISGMFNAALSLGAFIGPTAGSLCVEYVGFSWTTTYLCGSAAYVLLLLLLTNTTDEKQMLILRLEKG